MFNEANLHKVFYGTCCDRRPKSYLSLKKIMLHFFTAEGDDSVCAMLRFSLYIQMKFLTAEKLCFMSIEILISWNGIE